MKVLRLYKPFDMRFTDEPVPEVGPDEVLIKVGSVGVCASDVHYYREGRIGDQIVESPLVLGHEFSGTVVKTGENVTSISKGDRVAVEPGKPCGDCYACGRGLINLCPDVVFFGTPPVDGSLREYLAWPADLCIPIADSVSLDEAAMIEPLAVGVYAADLAQIRGGESAVILGAGAIGLSTLQGAKAAGIGKTVVTDPIPERRQAALRLGADVVFDPGDADCTEKIIGETDGGAQIVFECAGMPDAVWQSTFVARPKARLVIVGIPEEDSYCFNGSLSRRREVSVQFVRRSRSTAERSVKLVEQGKIDVRRYGTHVFDFDRAEDAFKLAMEKTDGVIRAVIRVAQ